MNGVEHYYFPGPTRWPIFGSMALLLMASGAATWLNHGSAGPYLLAAGLGLLVYMLFGWFGTVIRESEGGLYNKQVDGSYRWSMGWFIFSEVMVFAALFCTLFYIRLISVPDLASGETAQLWPGFKGGWPTAGPGIEGTFQPMATWGIPAINTLILLSSGAAVTWAHWNLKKGNRRQLKLGLSITIALGVLFLCMQASEYRHAYTALNLNFGTGAYGATFFALTGFHGFHVALGTTMLIVILARILRGQFTPEHHFAFEAVSWYWHFVGVVWLLLFVLVYWL